MGNGWICLHRSLLEHWVFTDALALKAWLHLLLTANHEDRKMFFNGTLITIKRGQHLTSVRKLAESWGCTPRKANSLLNCFLEDKMITLTRSKKGTLLTVVNYSVYQDKRNTESITESTTENITKGITESIIQSTQTTMNNNDKQEREDNPLPPVKVTRYPTGRYQNVFLSAEEASKLQKEFPEEAEPMIEKLSEYMETSGKKYQNHYAVIAKWIREDRANPKKQSKKEDDISARQRENYGSHWTDHIFDT